MPKFRFTATDSFGNAHTDVIEASDMRRASMQIGRSYARIDEIRQVGAAGRVSELASVNVGSPRIKKSSLSFMCSQMSTLLNSGVTVCQSVRMLVGQSADKKVRDLLTKCADDVDGGVSLSAALEKNGEKAVPRTLIEIVRSGEESGSLSEAFEDMAHLYGKEDKTAKKIRSALIYPVFVMVVAVICVILVMIYVIPSMTQSFADYESELPLITKILIAISDFFRFYWWIPAGLIALAAGVFVFLSSSESTRRMIDRLKLKLPIFGKINRSAAAGRFGSTFSALMHAGVPHVRALEVLSKVFGNAEYENAVRECAEKLKNGRSLEGCMREYDCFPVMLTDMCGTGEQTGNLEYTMRKAGIFFEEEAELASQRALAKLEPALLIVIAVVAAFIVMAVYLPMFQLYSLL